MALTAQLGSLEDSVAAAVEDLASRRATERLWAADHTLWADDPTEIADRVGWIPVVDEMAAAVGELETFARGCHTDGLRSALVLGMGGSSLFPEVAATTFGTAEGHLDVDILDTTDPAAVARVGTRQGRELETMLFLPASKSGTTIETRSALDTFWDRLRRGSQFTAITDPGSELAALAESEGYRRAFLNRSDIGGRFSALSYFGLVPAALGGAPVGTMLERAQAALTEYREAGDGSDAVRLGAAMAVASRQGRDKLTVWCDPRIAAFGDWLEQLVAESTGKAGLGVVPIVDEGEQPAAYGDDRLFVVIGDGGDTSILGDQPVIHLDLADAADLGRQVVLWEIATAMAGAVLGLNPFDQPDVASAKAATNRVLDDGLPELAEVPLESLTEQVRPGDYLAICAFVDPGSPEAAALTETRRRLGRELGVATTLGIGPRYLHSTGQLHKGKPERLVVVHTIGADDGDVAIPGKPYGFSTLKQAQAAGDLLALQDRGVRAGRVALADLV